MKSKKKILPCSIDKEGFSCQRNRDNRENVFLNNNNSLTNFLSKTYLNETIDVLDEYRNKEKMKTIFKRDVDEEDDDPWSMISPIGKKIHYPDKALFYHIFPIFHDQICTCTSHCFL